MIGGCAQYAQFSICGGAQAWTYGAISDIYRQQRILGGGLRAARAGEGQEEQEERQ